ncbi:MAG: hypothetical protein FD145_1591 [Candidatus Saganbacteria bacterium]|uniref:Uncharacterized protein n=1 Tax=Candidatus Saganbacteria bacterium TaxID=2575572 RepID=A0A833KZI5_UNCSA|nr:MAG: hypothetical protein FD145_1591 [Candidatus Saganbacteria bacterium]
MGIRAIDLASFNASIRALKFTTSDPIRRVSSLWDNFTGHIFNEIAISKGCSILSRKVGES